MNQVEGSITDLEEINEIMHNWVIYTHIFFVIPIVVCLYYSILGPNKYINRTYLFWIVLLTTVSIIYHLNPSVHWLHIWDVINCSVLILLIFGWVYYKFIFKSDYDDTITRYIPFLFSIICTLIFATIFFFLALMSEGDDQDNEGVTGKLFFGVVDSNDSEYMRNFAYSLYHCFWHIIVALGIGYFILYMNTVDKKVLIETD